MMRNDKGLKCDLFPGSTTEAAAANRCDHEARARDETSTSLEKG